MEIKNLLPPFLQNDIVANAYCVALTPIFDYMEQQAKDLLIYTNIENLNSEQLDLLAYGYGCYWYDPNLYIEQKRDLLTNVKKVFKIAGTVKGLEDVVKSIFGESKISEWFEYDSQFPKFKIAVDNEDATISQAKTFLNIINQVKNSRSILEKITFIKNSHQNTSVAYYGTVSKIIRNKEELNITSNISNIKFDITYYGSISKIIRSEEFE